MDIERINSDKAPAAVGPYVHAARVGDVVYTSGQIGLDPVTGTLVEGISAQAEQSLNNLRAVLESASMDLGNVIKTTVFLADMNDFPLINDIYARHFDKGKPARSCVQAAALPKGALFEIECVACKS